MPKVPARQEVDYEAQRRAQQSTRDEHGIHELAADEELIDEATFAQVQHVMDRARAEAAGGAIEIEPAPDDAPVVPEEVLLEDVVEGARPLGPVGVAELEARIHEARQSDELGRLALRLAGLHARAVALFAVHRGMIVGLHGAGEGLEQRTEGVMIPADSPSVFAAIAAGGRPMRLSDVVHGIDRQVLRALGRSDARDRLVVPIAIRGRVVNLLYADNGADPMGATSAAALGMLGKLVAQSYERMILRQKSARPVI